MHRVKYTQVELEGNSGVGELILKRKLCCKSEIRFGKMNRMICLFCSILTFLCLAVSGSDHLLSRLHLCFSVMECNMLGLSFDCHHRPTDYMGPQSMGKELSPLWWSTSTAFSQPAFQAYSQLGNVLVSQSIRQSVSQLVNELAKLSPSLSISKTGFTPLTLLLYCCLCIGGWMWVEVIYSSLIRL